MRYLRLFEEFDPIVQIVVRICEDFGTEMQEVAKSDALVAYRLKGGELAKDDIQGAAEEFRYLAEDLGYDLTFTRTSRRLVGSTQMPTLFYAVFHKGSLEDAALAWLKEAYGPDELEQRQGSSPGTPWVKPSTFIEWMKDGKQILKVYDRDKSWTDTEAFVNYHQTWALLDEMFNSVSKTVERILCEWAGYVTGREIKKVSIY